MDLKNFQIVSFVLIELFWLGLLIKNNSVYFSNFGEKQNLKKQFEIARVLFKQYSKQQRWAFGLVWLTIAWSVVLGSYLIISIINGVYGLNFLVNGIGLAGGVGICISAFRLYSKASIKLEELLKKIFER